MNKKQLALFLIISLLLVACKQDPKPNSYFAGVVKDASGIPIQGVLVTNTPTDNTMESAWTDKNGCFILERKLNNYNTLNFSKGSYKDTILTTIDWKPSRTGKKVIYSSFVTSDTSSLVMRKAYTKIIDLDSIAKLYTAVKTKENEKEEYAMQLMPDGSVIYTSRASNSYCEDYYEYTGSIKQMNDSVFNISIEKQFSMEYMKSMHYNKPICNLLIDSTLSKLKDFQEFDIILSNGTRKKVVPERSADRDNLDAEVILGLAPKLFNKQVGTDYYIVDLKRNDPITGKQLHHKIYYNCTGIFESKADLKFSVDVTIKNNTLKRVDKTTENKYEPSYSHYFPHDVTLQSK